MHPSQFPFRFLEYLLRVQAVHSLFALASQARDSAWVLSQVVQVWQVLLLACAYFPDAHVLQESVLVPCTTILPSEHCGHASSELAKHPDLYWRCVVSQVLQALQVVWVFTTAWSL